jgi:hypothetical protein
MQECLKLNNQDDWFQQFVSSFKHNLGQHLYAKKLIKDLDARRGCNFAATFPDLVTYFID